MEKDPIRSPLGDVHKVGMFLVEKWDTQYNSSISATIPHLEIKTRNTNNNNHKKGKDSRITNNHTQSLQTYSETIEYTLKSSKNNKNPVIVKKESLSCNKGSQ